MAQQTTQAAGSSQPNESQQAVEAVWRYGLGQLSGHTHEWASHRIHAVVYIETARNEAILRLHRTRATKKAKDYYGTPYTNALWNGIHLMQREMGRCLKCAIERGHLLYCWDGSTLPAAREQALGLAS
jgi:hypothetical protein